MTLMPSAAPRRGRPKKDAAAPPTSAKELKDTLWKAADKLRGSMDASQYKDVILGLVFLKYLSDAFDERRDQLEAELAEQNFDSEQIEALLDECLPDRSDPSSGARDVPAADSLPPEAVAMMVRDFVDYSLGLMPPSRQRELWEGLDAWQDKYWQAFSPELRAFVKARLEGRLAEDEFWSAVFSLLGL